MKKYVGIILIVGFGCFLLIFSHVLLYRQGYKEGLNQAVKTVANCQNQLYDCINFLNGSLIFADDGAVWIPHDSEIKEVKNGIFVPPTEEDAEIKGKD